jgi:hypothetical protein
MMKNVAKTVKANLDKFNKLKIMIKILKILKICETSLKWFAKRWGIFGWNEQIKIQKLAKNDKAEKDGIHFQKN